MIVCPKCKIEKPQEDFYKRSNEKYYRSYCKSCDKKDYTEFRKRNPHVSHLSNAKQRSKKLNLCFDLDKAWFYENLKDSCPIFKTPYGEGVFAPSIDRIDSKKGYTKDNCQIISMRANRIKNDATVDELLAIVNYLSSPTSAAPGPF